jgi:hypothetical protein
MNSVLPTAFLRYNSEEDRLAAVNEITMLYNLHSAAFSTASAQINRFQSSHAVARAELVTLSAMDLESGDAENISPEELESAKERHLRETALKKKMKDLMALLKSTKEHQAHTLDLLSSLEASLLAARSAPVGALSIDCLPSQASSRASSVIPVASVGPVASVAPVTIDLVESDDASLDDEFLDACEPAASEPVIAESPSVERPARAIRPPSTLPYFQVPSQKALSMDSPEAFLKKFARVLRSVNIAPAGIKKK